MNRLLAAWIVLVMGCSAMFAAAPADSVLQDKVLEIARQAGFTELYQDREEGLFVWRVSIRLGANSCPGLFAWYLKRVDQKVSYYDPVYMPLCEPGLLNQALDLRRKLNEFQLDFFRRWRDAVGPVAVVPYTERTHSIPLARVVLALLHREQDMRIHRDTLPAAPEGFAWHQLAEINATVPVPVGWNVKRVASTQGAVQLAYFISAENIDAQGSFDTGLTIHVQLHPKSEDIEATAKAMAVEACGKGEVLAAASDAVEGVLHRYGCVIGVQGKTKNVVLNYQAVANTNTRLIYVLFFESPADRWNEVSTQGRKMIELLLFDPNV